MEEVTLERVASKRADGTSLRGYIRAPYRKLVATFGKPLKGDGYKTDAEWVLEAPDGTIITIYNYKIGKSYLGPAGTPVSKIVKWNIGGHIAKALVYVRDALKLAPSEVRSA